MNQPPVFRPTEPPTLKHPLGRRRRRGRVIAISLGLLLFSFLTGLGLLWWQGNALLDGFSAGKKKELVENARPALGVEPRKKLPGLREAKTMLLLGSDTREDSGETWGRADTILVVRVYAKERAVSVLSLPRDLLVDIPGYGSDKINAAYAYGGPRLMIETVREYTGVAIDHFFEVGFDGFAEMVDSLGGAFIPVDQRYFHSNEGLPESEHYSEIDLRPGYQRLDAEDALAFVRFRHADSDFLRAARQQIFLREAGRQVREMAGGGIGEIRRLAEAFSQAAASDLDSLSEAFRLALDLRRIPSERIARITMEADSLYENGVSYVVASPEQKKQTLQLWNNPKALFGKQKQMPRSSETSLAALKLFSWLEQAGGSEAFTEIEPLKEQIRKSRLRIYGQKEKKTGQQKEAQAPLEENPAAVSPYKPLQLCRPTRLPTGYFWPEESEHRYELEGHPALAMYATRQSGSSILWMWTDWDDPPALRSPDDAILAGGRKYELFWESGAIRSVAWWRGRTRIWITNTLGNELDEKTMISLARSCEPI